MYNIPENFDLRPLKGSCVQQICFSMNNVIFFFENIGFVQIDGEFIYESIKGTYNFKGYPIVAEHGIILNLLQKTVVSIETNKNRNNLTIGFDNKENMIIHGDENYESYVININGKKLIV